LIHSTRPTTAPESEFAAHGWKWFLSSQQVAAFEIRLGIKGTCFNGVIKPANGDLLRAVSDA